MTTQPDHGEQDQQAVGQPGEQLQQIATPPISAAHVIRFTTRDAISVAEPRPEADPLPDEVEDRPPRDRRDASAHLRVDDDPDDTDHDHPEQLEAEGRARLRVEDEIADVDETADRREDAERDLEDLHFASLSAASASSLSGCSSDWASWRSVGCRCSCSSCRETFPASLESLRTSGVIPGDVGALAERVREVGCGL